MEGDGFSRHNVESIDESSETLFQKRRCSFFFCGNGGLCWWQKMRPSEIKDGGGNSMWERGVSALKKVREWSEIVAGPRWKTFIRRFRRNRSRGDSGKQGNFKYDPFSYAMNFDEGPGQNGHLEDDGEDGYFSRNFSSRYARGSMDLGKDGPNSV